MSVPSPALAAGAPEVLPDSLSDLRAMLEKARQGMNGLKEEMKVSEEADEATAADTESDKVVEENSSKGGRMGLENEPVRFERRDAWIEAGRGCGEETKREPEGVGIGCVNVRDDRPGATQSLSADVCKTRKGRPPGVCIGRPSHVDPVDVRVPRQREPLTKRGKRLERERRDSAKERSKNSVRKERMSRWGGDGPPREEENSSLVHRDDSNQVDLRGTCFAPPRGVEKVVPRERREKEPVTERGKRLKQERERAKEDGESLEAGQMNLFEIVKSDCEEFKKGSRNINFGSEKRDCIPLPFKEKKWFKQMEEIEQSRGGEGGFSEEAIYKRVQGGVIPRAKKREPEILDGGERIDVKGDEALATDSSRIIENLSKFEATRIVKIPPPPPSSSGIGRDGNSIFAKTGAGGLGPGSYLKVQIARGEKIRGKRKKHEISRECRRVLRERKEMSNNLGPGCYNIEAADKFVFNNEGQHAVIPKEKSDRAAKPNPLGRRSDGSGSESEGEFKVMIEEDSAQSGAWSSEGSSGSSSESDDCITSDASESDPYDTDSSSGSDCSTSSSSCNYERSSRGRRGRKKRKKKIAAPLTDESYSSRREHQRERSFASNRKRRQSKMLRCDGITGRDGEGESEEGDPKRKQQQQQQQQHKVGQIKKIVYGVFKGFFKKSTDIPAGWRQISVSDIEGRKKEILRAIGPTEVYHLSDGRICGIEHGGTLSRGDYDSFGVKKRYFRSLEKRSEGGGMTLPSSDSSVSNTSCSTSLYSTSTTSTERKAKQQEESCRNNMGWIMLTTTDGDMAGNFGRGSKGFSFAPKQKAGVTWKNRKILAERAVQRVLANNVGVGSYNLDYGAVEKSIKATPLFEKAEVARKREANRVAKNKNLVIRRAQEVVAEKNRATYLKTQLPKKWVADGEGDDEAEVLKTAKPVFSYREPVPLSKQAVEKRKLEKIAASQRDGYLSTQLPSSWAADTPSLEQQSLYRKLGRDAVVVMPAPDGGFVSKRVGFSQDVRPLKSPTGALRGPGQYDIYDDDLADQMEGDIRQSAALLAAGRGDAVGPFGERPPNALDAEVEDMGGKDGDKLDLDVDRAERNLRGSVQGVVFGTAGVDDFDVGYDKPAEGDMLDLQLDDNVGRHGRRKVGDGVLEWAKMEGREELHVEPYDERGADGDNLVLEVEEAQRRGERKVQNVVIGESKRWIEGREGDERQGDALTLSPHVTPAREKAGGYGFVGNFDKMIGRNDREYEDAIIERMDGDRRGFDVIAADVARETDENLAKLVRDGKIGGKLRMTGMVDFGASGVERFRDEVRTMRPPPRRPCVAFPVAH